MMYLSLLHLFRAYHTCAIRDTRIDAAIFLCNKELHLTLFHQVLKVIIRKLHSQPLQGKHKALQTEGTLEEEVLVGFSSTVTHQTYVSTTYAHSHQPISGLKSFKDTKPTQETVLRKTYLIPNYSRPFHLLSLVVQPSITLLNCIRVPRCHPSIAHKSISQLILRPTDLLPGPAAVTRLFIIPPSLLNDVYSMYPPYP